MTCVDDSGENYNRPQSVFLPGKSGVEILGLETFLFPFSRKFIYASGLRTFFL